MRGSDAGGPVLSCGYCAPQAFETPWKPGGHRASTLPIAAIAAIAAIVAMVAVTIAVVPMLATMIVVPTAPILAWKNTAREEKHRSKRSDQHCGGLHPGFLMS